MLLIETVPDTGSNADQGWSDRHHLGCGDQVAASSHSSPLSRARCQSYWGSRSLTVLLGLMPSVVQDEPLLRTSSGEGPWSWMRSPGVTDRIRANARWLIGPGLSDALLVAFVLILGSRFWGTLVMGSVESANGSVVVAERNEQ